MSSRTCRRSRGVAREAGALVVVDAVSSLGAVPLETDAWGLDVVVAGSQKALMTPPGLSLVDRLGGRVGAVAALDDAALLLRLGAHARRARDRLDAVHAGGHHRRGARRRARPAARGGARRRLRAPRRARPGLPRGREGDGARAVLARRGALGGRDGDPHAGRRGREASSSSSSATASASPSPARTESSDRGCSGSATSATTTCSTSRRRSPPSRRSWSSAARRSSAGVAAARALEAYHDAARV